MRISKEEVERIEKEIEERQETIYHFLGHVLGNRLALKYNINLGDIKSIKIGNVENRIVLKQNRTYYKRRQEEYTDQFKKFLSDQQFKLSFGPLNG